MCSLVQAQQTKYELVTDRPDQTESSSTVPPGYVQFEFGWTHTEDGDPDIERDAIPETLVRAGLSKDLEFRLGFDGWQCEDIDSSTTSEHHLDGRGDASVGIKWKIMSEDYCFPEVALIPSLSLPIGADDVTSDRFDPSYRLAFSHTISNRFSLGYNLGQALTTEEDELGDHDTRHSFLYTLVLGAELMDRLDSFVELFGDMPTGSEGGPKHSFDLGLTYLLQDNLQIDMLFGFGLSDSADDWFFGTGVVYRFPN